MIGIDEALYKACEDNRKSEDEIEEYKEIEKSLNKECEEKDKEIERLNNIINELHKALNKEINNLQNAKVESKEYVKCRTLCDILNKLSDLIGELKESDNNE